MPALTWGTHMRARRRQGWWVCAFGVALTAPVAYALVDPGRTVLEATLATAYGAVIGLLIGYLLIRIDLQADRPPIDRAARPAARRDRGGDGHPARARPYLRPLVNRA